MHIKQCIQCSKTFRIEDQDLEFYKKINVPEPTYCPDCRSQRRLAWRNEWNYYQRKCDLTGKPIISIYRPDSPIKRVYQQDAWFSDQWDAKDYGRDFDFNRPFFEQFNELMCEVPHIALWAFENENADYNHCCHRLKNSYMNAATDKSEDSYYCYLSINNRSVMDCTSVENSELAYACIDSDTLYNCAFSQLCRQCSDVYFSYDCMDCKYVFGSAGLRHKQYYIYNKPVTPEEWERRIPNLLGSYSATNEALKKAYETQLSFPRRYTSIFKSEQATGDYIWNCKNVERCFDCRHGENLKYVTYAPMDVKDSMDCYAVGDAEMLYDANFGGLQTYNTQFSFWLKQGPNNSQYCILCVNDCNNLFACVGLRKQQYCIFNKQYSKESFDKLRTKIIAHMKTTGEYGQLFPVELSPFAYNETIAQDYYHLNQDDVQRRGWKWLEAMGGTRGKQTITSEEIPDQIKDVPESITKAILECIVCQKNYRIISQELALYRQLNMPLPRTCPYCRHLDRLQRRNPRQLWQRQCMCLPTGQAGTQPNHQHHGRCSNEFETTYSPERKELIYCEQCYQKEIY